MGELTKGISTDKEAQGLSPERKEQKRLRSSSQRSSTRTTGFGYAGLMNDPDNRSSGDVLCVRPWLTLDSRKKKRKRGNWRQNIDKLFFL